LALAETCGDTAGLCAMISLRFVGKSGESPWTTINHGVSGASSGFHDAIGGYGFSSVPLMCYGCLRGSSRMWVQYGTMIFNVPTKLVIHGYSWLFYVILRIGNHLGLIILTLTASCHPRPTWRLHENQKGYLTSAVPCAWYQIFVNPLVHQNCWSIWAHVNMINMINHPQKLVMPIP
jgi:hypothetical protein